LASDLWSFTDDETRFLVARELAHIHKNDALLRIAMKTALLASLFILYATPIGWFAGCLVMAASAVLHLLSERSFQAKMDLAAIEIVSKRLGDRPRAIKAALSVLEKLQNQNLARREHSALCRLYLSKSGNNFLDFCRPYITSRIDRIRKSSLPV
jgi:Zn-dependent protease with chaperone function